MTTNHEIFESDAALPRTWCALRMRAARQSAWAAITMFGLACAVGCNSDTKAGSTSPANSLAGTPAGPIGAGSSGKQAPVAGNGTGPIATQGAVAGGGPLAAASGGGGSPAAAGGSGSGTAGQAAPVASQALPCGVSGVLATQCAQCHGKTPIGGAPMPLMTHEDFHRQAKTAPTLKVYELAKQRINSQAKPMPPGGAMKADAFSTLDSWLGAGAPAAVNEGADCPNTPPGTVERPGDGTFGALTPAPGETCYDFVNHQSTTSVDATPYSIAIGEHYEQFYFKAPWPKGAVATRYGTKIDNEKVLHHWLLFSTTESYAEGFHKTAPLPTLIGLSPTLLAGWAVGGDNLAMPADVGLELPAPGTMLNVQWHFYNSTDTIQTDRTAIQICTVPAGTRPHTASMTWVGNEDLGGNAWFGGAGMPPHQVSSFAGTCSPLRTGMNTTDPIHILAYWPHMHRLGVHMKTVINRKGAAKETVFDKPFDFNHQIHYPVNDLLMPGDTITATCTFNNTTDRGVPFGESTDTEMCYQFMYSWPAHALENHAPSLIGATNTCW